MTTISVNEQGVGDLLRTVDSAVHEAVYTATWVGTSGLGHAAISVLTGHGLGAIELAGKLEGLAARLGNVAYDLETDRLAASQWADALLGSQVFATRGTDWVRVIVDAHGLVGVLSSEGKWLIRALNYSMSAQWADHARRWTFFGHFGNALTSGGAGVLTLVADFIPGAIGQITSAVGSLATSAYGVGVVLVHQGKYVEYLGGKAATKALLPLTVIQTAWSVDRLATSDYRQMHGGDAAGHDHLTRQYLYGAKALETAGTLLFAAAPFTGPAAPFVAGAGLVLTGAAAAINGVVFATDYLHAHESAVNAKEQALVATASAAWVDLTHPILPHWSL